MTWKYCYNCGDELDRPTIEQLQEWGDPSCICGASIDCTVEEILIDTIVELKEQVAILSERLYEEVGE